MIVTPSPVRTIEQNRAAHDCSVKVRYTSKKFAKGIASRVQRTTGTPTAAYHCEIHHCWHTGTKPGHYKQRIANSPIERITSGPLAGCTIIRSRSAPSRGM